MTTPAKSSESALTTIEQVLVKGDLTPLTPEQREKYVQKVCDSLGLNYWTKPFAYIVLNGQLQLYALRTCTDQLRKVYGVSVEVLREQYDRGMLTVYVRARDKSGRTDEDFGSVPWSEKMAPEFASNLKMKCITKAKRRVTLSICGLGWLDETEVEDIPAQDKLAPAEKYRQPESGPNMTRKDAFDFGTKLLAAMRGYKHHEGKQTALDMAHDELQRMRRDQPDGYDWVIKEIEKEMTNNE